MRMLFYVLSCAVIVSCAGTVNDVPETVGNPYLPLWEHIPDGEPYVFEDPDYPGNTGCISTGLMIPASLITADANS